MINVFIKTESHYRIDKARVKGRVEEFLKSRGLKGNIEVSLSFIGDRYMKVLNKKYRDLDETTAVLTFGLDDQSPDFRFVDPPDQILRLGDILISYPQARDMAADEEKLVDDMIDELIEHGMNNLLETN